VVRLPVRFWISKGAIMPGFPLAFRRLAQEHDAIVMNLPNTPVEAWTGPLLARLMGKPLVAKHMCDVQLPPGAWNAVVNRAVFWSSLFACALSDRVISMTRDYAKHSPVLRRVLGKVTAVLPPIEMAPVPALAGRAWIASRGISGAPLIGFSARIATEKGVEVILKALPHLRHEFPEVCVLFAGDHAAVIGESNYRKRLHSLLEANNGNVAFLGVLSQDELPFYYSACDVTVLPSLNRTESFGLVQAESMMCGTPVVASDLPGVRQCVRYTGMGRIVRAGDEHELAEAVQEVIRFRDQYVRPRDEIERVFTPERTRRRYETILSKVTKGRQTAWTHLREKPWFLALQRSVEQEQVTQAGPFVRPILDVGCGDGHFGPVSLGCSIDAGLDADPTVVRRATGQRLGNEPAYVRVVTSPAAQMPFPDDHFATLLSNSTLEHIVELDAALREMFRVLKPGGRLIATVPTDQWEKSLAVPSWLCRLGLRSLSERYRNWFRGKQRHHHLLSADDWVARVEAAGFRVTCRRRYLSATATAWVEVLHYAGWHNLLAKAILGRWVWVRWRPLFVVSEWMVTRFMGEGERSTDSCLYLEATKPGGAE
jgi:glycosyltransferase involved in cell wall biosynthesis